MHYLYRCVRFNSVVDANCNPSDNYTRKPTYALLNLQDAFTGLQITQRTTRNNPYITEKLKYINNIYCEVSNDESNRNPENEADT